MNDRCKSFARRLCFYGCFEEKTKNSRRIQVREQLAKLPKESETSDAEKTKPGF
jgi:hypothetical protein